MNSYVPRARTVPRDAVITDDGIAAAIIHVDQDFEVSLSWLPELFAKPLPPALRTALVERLRFHADHLESGETERRMQPFRNINTQ